MPEHHPEEIAQFAYQLQTAIGQPDFEQQAIIAFEASRLIPSRGVHAVEFDPVSNQHHCVDRNGPVELQGSPLGEIVGRHNDKLPRFRNAVETQPLPTILSRYHSEAEVQQSDMYRHVLQPFGIVDVMFFPLLRNRRIHSLFIGSDTRYTPEHERLANVLHRNLYLAMRNHYWLLHAETNGQNIEQVNGPSSILALSPAGKIDAWPAAMQRFFTPDQAAGLSEPPLELRTWIKDIIAHFPFSSPDNNTLSLSLIDGEADLIACFLGGRDTAHRLLLYRDSAPIEDIPLGPREREVLSWIVQGKTNSEIAIILNISENTVRNHAASIFKKMHVENRSAAAAVARGWFD
jgi:DNA-binding CsgD family transcriptional regulator